MPRQTLPKLPLAPLHLEARRQGTTINATLRAAGLPELHRGNEISWLQADRLSCALGCHPATVWGDAWFAISRVEAAYEAGAGEREARWAERRARRRKDAGWREVERSWREWRDQIDRRVA